jgi:hypothetical protein
LISSATRKLFSKVTWPYVTLILEIPRVLISTLLTLQRITLVGASRLRYCTSIDLKTFTCKTLRVAPVSMSALSLELPIKMSIHIRGKVVKVLM